MEIQATVSTASLVCMGLTVLICLALTVGLFFILRKRLGLKAGPLFTGAAAFVVFVLGLESLLHSFVLTPAADGSIAMLSTPWLYVLYGTLAAGVFEETARFLCFILLRRKYNGFPTAISYGIGHGGIEVLLLAMLATISNILLAVMMNSGGAAAILSASPEAADAMTQLAQAEPWLFLASGYERIIAMAAQISLSVLVWHGVNTKGRIWLFPAAIALHALVDVPAAMFQCGQIQSVLTVELLTTGVVAAVVYLTVALHRRFHTPEAAVQEG